MRRSLFPISLVLINPTSGKTLTNIKKNVIKKKKFKKKFEIMEKIKIIIEYINSIYFNSNNIERYNLIVN